MCRWASSSVADWTPVRYVALMSEVSSRPVRTFSIGFEEASYSELPAARLVASRFGADSYVSSSCGLTSATLLPELIRNFDEPFADSSAIPTYYVSQLARSHVTVTLGGDGGDEVFAGYQQYAATKFAGYYRRLPWPLRRWLIAPAGASAAHLGGQGQLRLQGQAIRGRRGSSPPSGRTFWWRAIFSEEAKAQLYRPGISAPGRAIPFRRSQSISRRVGKGSCLTVCSMLTSKSIFRMTSW